MTSKRWNVFGIVILILAVVWLFVEFVMIGIIINERVPVDTSQEEEHAGELIAMDFKAAGYFYPENYSLFTEKSLESPLTVYPGDIMFVYDSTVINPRVIKKLGGKFVVYFRDAAQFREYLR